MKDLVDLFNDEERKFRSGGYEQEARCTFCRETFTVSDLKPAGEHFIRGRHHNNAKACPECHPGDEVEVEE